MFVLEIEKMKWVEIKEREVFVYVIERWSLDIDDDKNTQEKEKLLPINLLSSTKMIGKKNSGYTKGDGKQKFLLKLRLTTV